MIGELLPGPVGVKERISGLRRRPVLRLEVQLLDHRDERRHPGAGAHHEHVLEAGRALGEREVADDALDVGEAVVAVVLDTAEERLGESPEHSLAVAFEHHVELEVVVTRRLERG